MTKCYATRNLYGELMDRSGGEWCEKDPDWHDVKYGCGPNHTCKHHIQISDDFEAWVIEERYKHEQKAK